MPRLGWVLALVAVACSQGPEPSGRVYRVGYMICNSREETLQRFAPLTAYLGEQLGVRLEAVAIDTVDFTKNVDALDFTHTNSLLYVIMHRHYGVEVLAAEKAGPLGARAKGLIIVPAKSDITSVGALRGRGMVFGPTLGPTSYMAQLDVLRAAGVDADKDLGYYAIPSGSYKHEKVVYGVLFGKYDAGAVPLLDYDRMAREGKIDAQDFRILGESEPIPYCNFAVTQRVDDALATRFRKALLGLTPASTGSVDGEVIKVLARAGIDGYEAIADEDFEGVRAMAKRTNMPPYQRY